MVRPASCAMLAMLCVLSGCAPALNWREIDGVEGRRWWFPCKPDRIERTASIEGRALPARLAVCDAQGATWSTLALQFPGPAEAAQALEPARLTLMMNLQAAEQPQPVGLAPKEASLRWWSGRRPGGEAVQVAVQFGVQGRWLVQQVLMVDATAAGASAPAGWPAALPAQALDTFFAGAMPR